MVRVSNILASAVGALLLGHSASAVGFDIDLRLEGAFSDSQRLHFLDAERYWESMIVGYQPGISIKSLDIVAAAEQVDGGSGVLAFAGLTAVAVQGGFVVPHAGTLTLDSADLAALEASGRLGPVIAHEIAHLMGFGLLWASNDVYVAGSGLYKGVSGIAAYRAEFDPSAAFVPVELNGGAGTSDFHWAEDWAGGRSELMTGFLNTPAFVSRTTLASFQDIGYAIAPSVKAVPLPPTAPLAAAAFAVLVAAARVSSRG